MNDDIKKIYKDEYENNGINRIYKEIEGLNVKFKGQLKDSSLKENFVLKFNNFYDEKIIWEIRKKMFKKASIIYMKESLEFFIEFLSENITEEELEDIANSTLDNLLRKIVETNC